MIEQVLAGLIRLFTGVRLIDSGLLSEPGKVFYAAHTSHFDFLTVWAALPRCQRATLRPVAARDYWEQGKFRRWLARDVFRAILIDRIPNRKAGKHPLYPLLQSLDAGETLLLFPEGTRKANSEGDLAPFKSGIFHLANKRPDTLFVPVQLDNLGRILPKGEILPLPLIAHLDLATPFRIRPGESKSEFLERARRALQAGEKEV